jgi:hypothetical protein
MHDTRLLQDLLVTYRTSVQTPLLQPFTMWCHANHHLESAVGLHSEAGEKINLMHTVQIQRAVCTTQNTHCNAMLQSKHSVPLEMNVLLVFQNAMTLSV